MSYNQVAFFNICKMLIVTKFPCVFNIIGQVISTSNLSNTFYFFFAKMKKSKFLVRRMLGVIFSPSVAPCGACTSFFVTTVHCTVMNFDCYSSEMEWKSLLSRVGGQYRSPRRPQRSVVALSWSWNHWRRPTSEKGRQRLQKLIFDENTVYFGRNPWPSPSRQRRVRHTLQHQI